MSDHQGRITLRDSLIVTLSAEHRRAQIAEGNVGPVKLALAVLTDVRAIEKELDKQEDAETFEELKTLTEAFQGMRERHERREIAGLFMEFVRSTGTLRSKTLNRWALEVTIKLAGMTPASVNNDHIKDILDLVEDARARIEKAMATP